MIPQLARQNYQGTCDSDATCLYSPIAKPNMTIKIIKETKSHLQLFGSDM